MATETVNHDTGNRIGTKAEALRQRAIRLLEAIQEEEGKAFAVATAGRALVDGENQINERRLFEAIEDILSDATLPRELELTITELAALVEASHG